MDVAARAKALISEFDQPTRMGAIKKRAKEIKKDHALAEALWASGAYYPRLLAVLVFDKKLLTPERLDGLAADMLTHEDHEQQQLCDWLLANQLMKDKALVALLVTWEHASSPILRRLFWYHQGRLRWMGKTPPDNSVALLESLEARMADEHPMVQWTMNFCAGWIGIFEPEHRARCVALGETLGLYEHDPVSRNCTPSYLPEFIRIEVAKRAG